MIGSLGGFLGPYLTGAFKRLTGNFAVGLLVVGALGALGAGLCLALPKAAAREPEQAGNNG